MVAALRRVGVLLVWHAAAIIRVLGHLKENDVRAHEKCIFIKNRMRNDRQQLLAACCTQLAVPLRYFLNIRLSCHHSARPSLSLPLSALHSRVLRKSHKSQCVDYAIFMFAFARAAHKKADNNALHLAVAAARTDSGNKGE